MNTVRSSSTRLRKTSVIERAPRRTLGSALRSERDLLPVLGIAWLVSLLRVAGALWRHEVFGVEATLACVALVAIPLLAIRRRGAAPRSELN